MNISWFAWRTVAVAWVPLLAWQTRCSRMKTMIGIHRIATAPTDQECCPAPRDLWEILGDLWYTTSDCTTCPIRYSDIWEILGDLWYTAHVPPSHIWKTLGYHLLTSVKVKVRPKTWTFDPQLQNTWISRSLCIWSNVVSYLLYTKCFDWWNERWCCDDTCTRDNLTWIASYDKIPQVEVESFRGGVDCQRVEVEQLDMSQMIKKSQQQRSPPRLKFATLSQN